jgi:hypothetical protein
MKLLILFSRQKDQTVDESGIGYALLSKIEGTLV